MLLPARFDMKAGVIDGIIYVVGGDTGVEPNRQIANVDAYNVATDTWAHRQQLPNGRSKMNGASAIAGKLYVTGGLKPNCAGSCTTFQSRNLFVYDPVFNSWVKKANMPVEGSNGAQGVIGGRLYVYLGEAASGGDLFFRYNPDTDTWTQRAAPPIEHVDGVAGVINGKFYLVGGRGGSDFFPTTSLHVYDPATNTWTTKAPMSTRRRNFAGGVIHGKLYVAGGANDLDELLTTSEVYDPLDNTWTTTASMLTEQAGGASAATSGRLFVMGGFNNAGVTRKVQSYTPGSAQTPAPSSAAVTVGRTSPTSSACNCFSSDRNGTFNPAVDTVAVNGTVTWTSAVGTHTAHTVQSLGSPSFASSGTLSGIGATYAVTFSAPGTYQYNCAFHPAKMIGRIVVR